MERVTQWLAEGVAGIATDLEEKYTAEELVDILVQHLAPYEDTGLEPRELSCVNLGTGCDATQICVCHGLIRKAVKELEEYKALGPIEHLRTIVKAEEALRKEAK